MIKTIFVFILFALVSLTVKSQHLIITNSNDSIEAKILDRDDSLFHFKRISKPRKEEYIAIYFVKKLIAIGDDTLYNIFSNVKESESEIKTTTSIKSYNLIEVVILDSSQTKDKLFNKAQKFIALNFKNSQKVVQLSDRISGTLICKGTMKTYFEGIIGTVSPGYMEYTINFAFKDGKYRLEISQVQFQTSNVNCSGVYPIDYPKTPCGLWESNWEEIKENYSQEMKEFIDFLKKEMLKPVNEDW